MRHLKTACQDGLSAAGLPAWVAGLLLSMLPRPPAPGAQETEVKMISEGEVKTTSAETIKEGKAPESFTASMARAGEEGGTAGSGTEPAAGNKTISFEIPLKVDGLYTYMSDLQVSDIPQDRAPDEVLYPNGLGMNQVGGARFRLSPKFDYKDKFLLFGEADLLLYPFGDDPVGVERSSDFRTHSGELRNWMAWFNPRQLYMQLNLPVGIIRAGQMGSSWGMGILANDGSKDPVFGTVFGGDIVERVLFATKPFYKLGKDWIKDFTMAAAGDLVFDDITAKLYEGDLAWQAVLALRWSWRNYAAGFYFVYRDQTKSDDRTLDVFVFDGYLNLSTSVIETLSAYVEGELAYIMGETTLAYSIQQPGGHDVSQLGAAGRIGLKWLETIHLCLELGYASGDANNYDHAIHSFTMDPNHRVGLILFPEVLAWQSARSADLAGSDEITGVDNPGIELLPTNGGVASSTLGSCWPGRAA
jgi:hypothetical protein